MKCCEFLLPCSQVGSPPPRHHREPQIKKHWESLGGNNTSFLQCLHSAKQQTRSKTPSARRYFCSYCASHIAMATSNMLLPLLPLNSTLFTTFPRRMMWTSVETSPGRSKRSRGPPRLPQERRTAAPGQRTKAKSGAECRCMPPLAVAQRPGRPPHAPLATRGLKISCGALFLQPALPGRHSRSAPLPPLERARAPVSQTVIGSGLSLAKWLCREFNPCSSNSKKAWSRCSVKFCQWAL